MSSLLGVGSPEGWLCIKTTKAQGSIKSKLGVGNRIKKARKEIGISQKQLAGYLRVSDKAVSSYEVGRTTPSFETIKKIGKIVHKPIAYFDKDSGINDLDLQIKIKTIEKELLEIKKLLKKRK